MCSFGSCQTRLEFLSQFRKVRNAFECFVTQVQTHLPKTKCVWPIKINVICTVVKPLFRGPFDQGTPLFRGYLLVWRILPFNMYISLRVGDNFYLGTYLLWWCDVPRSDVSFYRWTRYEELKKVSLDIC